MINHSLEKIVASAYVDLAGQVARIEKLSTGAMENSIIRISASRKEKNRPEPLSLSEEELIELLHTAIHAGVISQGFIGKLREKIEI